MSPISAWPPYLVPLGTLLLALLLALAINALVIARRPSRDSGDLWTGVLAWSGTILALSLLYGWTLQILDSAWWAKGYHPFFDQTGLTLDLPWLPPWELKVPSPRDPSGQRLQHPEWWALALPFAVWGLTIAFRLALGIAERQPGQPRPGAWLAGCAGFAASRRWAMYTLAPPFLLLLLWTANDLGEGAGHDRAALWGTLAVVALTLVAIAFSRGRAANAPVETTRSIAEPEPGDWVAAMRQRGFAVQTLCRLEPSGDATQTSDPAARAIVDQWPFLRERQVAPELIETVADLVAVGDARRRGPDRLVLAPDDCGQLETLAIAVRLVHSRLEMVTLIVVPRDPEWLAGRVVPWLPAPNALDLPKAGLSVDAAAMAWIVDAGSLSERLADLADSTSLLGRIGLVVWWDLDAYSGVLAANVWAVSHRLHRLLRRKGHKEARSIAFARYRPSHEANSTAFLSQLLPYAYRAEDRVVVERRRRHPIVIRLLEPTLELRPTDMAHPDHWDPSLVAASTSVEAGWPTCLEPPSGLDLVHAADFMQQRVLGRPLSERLLPGHAEAGARILEARPAEVLSLGNLLSQGGRCLERPSEHQVGLLLPPGNPYVRHLLMTLQKDPGRFFSLARRLVPGVPQPAIVRRHLLLALREMEAVAQGLLNTFQWRDSILDPVLEELANRHRIERRDVRFLDRENRLRVDTGYKSSVAEYRPGPLDTVGDRLISIVEREAGDSEELLLRIDPERSTIVAYPRRVFRLNGRTYRMSLWPATDAQEIERRGLLYCTRTDDPALTWRIAEPRLRRTELTAGQGQACFDRAALNKVLIQTQYEEEVSGIVEVRRDAQGVLRQGEIQWDQPVSSLSFPTKGLMLRLLPEDVEYRPAALHSIAQALAQVLAVHVGVEEDAVRVVAAENLKMDRRREWGLAILDLYPQGIGLVDALNDDDALLRRMLEHTRDWLAQCPCGSDEGCPLCLQSPAAIAATRYSVERQLSRREAADVLKRVLGD